MPLSKIETTSYRYKCINTMGSFICELLPGKEVSIETTCEEYSITSDTKFNAIDDSLSNEISGIYQLAKGVVQDFKSVTIRKLYDRRSHI